MDANVLKTWSKEIAAESADMIGELQQLQLKHHRAATLRGGNATAISLVAQYIALRTAMAHTLGGISAVGNMSTEQMKALILQIDRGILGG